MYSLAYTGLTILPYVVAGVVLLGLTVRTALRRDK